MTRRVYYHDARNFGTARFSLSASELRKKLESLGVDVLGREFDEDSFMRVLEGQRGDLNICKFLMDQKQLGYNHTPC